VSRPKDIGTWTESQIVAACQRANIPAHRVALAGIHDQGDVWLHGGRLVVEAKGGKQTQRVSWAQLAAWLAQAEAEAGRVVQADAGILVVRRWGSGKAEDWTAHAYLDEVGTLLRQDSPSLLPRLPISMRLGDLLTQLTQEDLT
jgi:hypothetical protein